MSGSPKIPRSRSERAYEQPLLRKNRYKWPPSHLAKTALPVTGDRPVQRQLIKGWRDEDAEFCRQTLKCVFTARAVVAALLPLAGWSMFVCLALYLFGCALLVQGVYFGTRQVYQQLEEESGEPTSHETCEFTAWEAAQTSR
jgi:hypothetical protein